MINLNWKGLPSQSPCDSMKLLHLTVVFKKNYFSFRVPVQEHMGNSLLLSGVPVKNASHAFQAHAEVPM